jgi:hypothetical protein
MSISVLTYDRRPVRCNHLRCYLTIFDWRVDSVVYRSSRYVIFRYNIWYGEYSTEFVSNGYERLTKHIWDIATTISACTIAKNEVEICRLEHQLIDGSAINITLY